MNTLIICLDDIKRLDARTESAYQNKRKSNSCESHLGASAAAEPRHREMHARASAVRRPLQPPKERFWRVSRPRQASWALLPILREKFLLPGSSQNGEGA